MSKSYTQNYIT